jgi:hypothetical protein
MKLRLMWGRAQKNKGPDGVGGVPQPSGGVPHMHHGTRA